MSSASLRIAIRSDRLPRSADLITHTPASCSKVIGPVFEKLESSFPNIGFYKCDVDEQEVRRRAVFRGGLLRFSLFWLC